MERLQHALNHSLNYAGKMFVYVIQAGDYFKVGIASSVESRIASMQTGNPHRIKLLRCWLTSEARDEEAQLHALLAAYHFRGEWFNHDPQAIKIAMEFEYVKPPEPPARPMKPLRGYWLARPHR